MNPKKLLGIIAIAVMLCFASAFALIGCGAEGEKADYSVTVVDSAEAPVSGVTVTWYSGSSARGSAVTGEDGVAKASLVRGTYRVVLSGMAAGLAATEISVTAAMPDVTLTLEAAKVTYTATVVDKAGAPAANVRVSWSDGQTVKGTQTTGADGVASCELDYGDYMVSVANLPDGNVFGEALNATGTAPAVTFNLVDGVSRRVTVTVRSQGGLLFAKQSVYLYNGTTPVGTGDTDENGAISFELMSGVTYTVRPGTLQDGYTASPLQITADMDVATLVLTSSVILSEPADNKVYVLGDIIHDFHYTTPYLVNNKQVEYSIADLLDPAIGGKKAVLINNWGTNCSWCVREMPAMEELYQKYSDEIEILAISNYQGGDSDSVVANYRSTYNYTFPMMRDSARLVRHLYLEGWPTTLVIDRYGAIARIESGAITEAEVWERMLAPYLADDYVQTFKPGDQFSDSITNEVAKPDVEVPADHYEQLAATLNKFEATDDLSIRYYPETEYEYAWPFVIKAEEGVSEEEVVCSSNSGRANSMSILYADVKLPAGKVLVLDYWAQTEENEDVMSIVWDGKIINRISGDSHGWQTCYLYSDLVSGNHRLAFTYIKDSSVSTGKDNVYLRNIRFIDVDQIEGSADMLRAAAYGTAEEGANMFPYYADVDIAGDGYYHVDLDGLQNAEYAGVDHSPMLFVNMLNVTNWLNNYSIRDLIYATDADTGELAIDCTLTVNGVTRDYRNDLISYLRTASASDIEGFLPIDKDLHDLLVAFMAKVSGDNAHPDEWLEACYFYSHYGSDDYIGNPIIGRTEKTAIVVGEGTHTAHMTFNMAPFPIELYTFTPERDGVYRIESIIPESDRLEYAAQAWLYDEQSSLDKPLAHSGEDRMTRDGSNEYNFMIHRYLTAGHKYYLGTALQMAGMGVYDFRISYIGESHTELLRCSSESYWMILDEDGNFNGEIELGGAVDYVKDNEGYYHAINPGGTVGGYIYLDIQYPTVVGGSLAIATSVDRMLPDPLTGDPSEIKTFDFSKRFVYYEEDDFITYAVGDMSSWGDEYIDYTETVKGWVAQAAANTGDEAGFIRVNDEVVAILQLYIELRTNMMLNDVYDAALDNEWLRFCWYYRPYDQNNL